MKLRSEKVWFWAVFCSLILASATAQATTYYVKATGSDSASGLSDLSAWQSIAKVNAMQASLNAGDSVLFNRGDTFVGGLVLTKSGNSTAGPITYGAYGTGAKPIITGFVTVTSWTSVGNNIWEASWPGSLTTINSFLLNGQPQPLGRYPKITAPNRGYLSYDSFAGDTSITDAALSTAPNLAGGEIVLRMVHWLFHRATVSTQVGNTITFSPAVANPGTYPLKAGYGYFIQNHPATLTQNGDWYYTQTGRKIGLYSTLTPAAAKVSTVDQLVSITGRTDLSFSNLQFEGANTRAIWADASARLTIDSCDFRYAGQFAIRLNWASDVVITNNTITNSLNSGIVITSPNHDNLTIRGNTVTNTGMLPGQVNLGGDSGRAIHFVVNNNATVENNVVRDTGFLPIYFQGNHVVVRHNVCDGFASVLDDVGGIYSWNGGRVTYTDRLVEENIVSRGIGAPEGTSNLQTQANGIYLDNNTNNVDVVNNTIFDLPDKGFHFNSPQFISISRNTVYDTAAGFDFIRWIPVGSDGLSMSNSGQDIKDAGVTQNIFFGTSPGFVSFEYGDQGIHWPMTSTLQARLAAIGTINNNLYHSTEPFSFIYAYSGDAGTPQFKPHPHNLSQFKAFTGFEATGAEVFQAPPYTLNSTVGADRVTNGTFATGIGSMVTWSSPVNFDAYFDNTSQLTGTGSMRIEFRANADSNDSMLIYGALGATQASKKYVLRVSTRGSTAYGAIAATFRQTGSPYATIAPLREAAYGTARVNHEFVIEPAADEPATSFLLQLWSTGGTTWVDDIQVFEASVTPLDPLAGVRFEYNDTQLPRTIQLGGHYVDVRGASYPGTITLSPFTSAILKRVDGGIVDSGVIDAGRPDGGVVTPDSGVSDAGRADAGPGDAGSPVDAGRTDSGVVDAGTALDAGQMLVDAGDSDAGLPDASVDLDAGPGDTDAGQPADAGAPIADAGTQKPDAGDDVPPVPPCGCQTGSANPLFAGALLLLLRRRAR